MMAAFGLGHLRLLSHPHAPPLQKAAAAGALAAVVAVFTAGLFEYNFGDSEVLMLFLLVAAMPFGLRRVETVGSPDAG